MARAPARRSNGSVSRPLERSQYRCHFTTQSESLIIAPMATVRSIRAPRAEPVSLHTHAMDNLRFIRETMERAGSFTAVPGWGGVAMGISALAAAAIANRQPTLERWLITWLLEAAFAMALAVFAIKRNANAAKSA